MLRNFVCLFRVCLFFFLAPHLATHSACILLMEFTPNSSASAPAQASDIPVQAGLGHLATGPVGAWDESLAASAAVSACASEASLSRTAVSTPSVVTDLRPRTTSLSSALGGPVSSSGFGGPFYGGGGHSPFPAFMAPGPRPARHYPADGFYHSPSPPFYPYPWPQGYGPQWWSGPPMQGTYPTHSPTSGPPLPPTPPPLPPTPPPQPSTLPYQLPSTSFSEVSSEHGSSSPSYVEERGNEESQEEDFAYSFPDAIARLAIVSPEFLGAAPEAKSLLSAADKALGRTPKASLSASLKESSMVAEAFRSAQAKARGDGDAPLPGTVPAIPNALSVGTFVNQQSHLRR